MIGKTAKQLTTNSFVFAVAAVLDTITPEFLTDTHLILLTVKLLILRTDGELIL